MLIGFSMPFYHLFIENKKKKTTDIECVHRHFLNISHNN